MKARNKTLSTVAVVVAVVPMFLAPSQAKTKSECGDPPGEVIVEAGLGRTNVSGPLSNKDLAIVKQARARLVPRCTTRREQGDTPNLEEVLRTASGLEAYQYFAAVWGGGGLTVRGFVSKMAANRLTALRGPQFPMDTLSLEEIGPG